MQQWQQGDGPSLWTLAFWRQTVERAVKTFGGSAVTTFGGSAVPFFQLDLPWETSLKIVTGTVIVSLFFSLGSIRVGPQGTPSAVPLDETPGGERQNLHDSVETSIEVPTGRLPMFSYQRVSCPATMNEAREHAAELARKFVFDRYLVAEIVWPTRTEIDIVRVRDIEDEDGEVRGDYPTVNAVMIAYIEWHEEADAEVRSIAEARRP